MIRPEERNKVIGLVGAIVLVVIIIIWRLTSASAPQVATNVVVNGTPGAPPATSGIVSGAPSTVAMTHVDNEPDQIETPSLFAAANADPFRTVVPKVVPVVVAPPKARNIIRPVSDFNPHITGELLPPAGVGTPNVEVVKEAPPTLTGVISGEDGVAVLKSGTESFVVKKGQSFGNGYTVVSITDKGVKLRHKGEAMDIGLAP